MSIPEENRTMEILTQALSSRHRSCGLQLSQIGDDDVALHNKDGTIIRIFHHDAELLEVWEVADWYLLLGGTWSRSKSQEVS